MEKTENTTPTIDVEASAMIENMKNLLIDTAETYGTESQDWLNTIKFINRTLGDEAYKVFCAHMNTVIAGKYLIENATTWELKEWMSARLSSVQNHIRNVAYDMRELNGAIDNDIASKMKQMVDLESKLERDFLSSDVARLIADKERYSIKANALRTCKDILND